MKLDDVIEGVRGLIVIVVLIFVGWEILGVVGWQKIIIETGKLTLIVVGALLLFSLLGWIIYKVYEHRKAQEMQEKGYVKYNGDWVTQDERESAKDAEEGLTESYNILEKTEDPRVENLVGQATEAFEEKKYQEVKDLTEKIKEVASEKINRVVEKIESFEPEKEYSKERDYQRELRGFLSNTFSSAKTEEAKGSVRPDIVIDNIAIEIKGPTSASDLKSIADKTIRYLQHYEHLIVVLFDIYATEDHFEDWKGGMEREHPSARIIRK